MTVRSESASPENGPDQAAEAAIPTEESAPLTVTEALPAQDVDPMTGTDSEGKPDAETTADVTPPLDKVCRKCSVQTRTAGSFCPQCGASYAGRRLPIKINKRVALIVAAALVVVCLGIGIVLNVQHTNQVNAEKAAAAQVADAAAKAADAAKKREDDAAKAAASAAAAKAAADDAKRTIRKTLVSAVEDSILKDAQSRVTDGVLTGPISLASCTPVGGGSTDDLTAITGSFQCIAVNKTNEDGSSSGYRFSATVNWNDGSYTWHLGS